MGYLQVAQEKRLNMFHSCTLEIWMRPAKGGLGGIIFSKFHSDWWGVRFEEYGDSLRLRAMGDITVRHSIEPGKWTHLVAVLGGNGHMQIYANGKLLGEQKPGPMIVYW